MGNGTVLSRHTQDLAHPAPGLRTVGPSERGDGLMDLHAGEMPSETNTQPYLRMYFRHMSPDKVPTHMDHRHLLVFLSDSLCCHCLKSSELG